MREIKFRCWWDNKMHIVEEIDFKHKSVNLLGADIIGIKEGILMQYTGEKDRNKKEIYEGDILLAPCWIDEDIKCVCIYAQQNSTNEVIGYGLYSFDNYWKDYRNPVLSDEWDEFEVIGNIYENKELLGGKQ